MKFRLVENNLDPNAEKVIDQMPEEAQEDIEDLSLLLLERKQKLFEMYNNQNKKKIFEVYQLFSSMPYEAQMKVFLPSSKRKVIC